jgi:hypothetical protein
MYKLYLKVKERVEGIGLLVIREVRSAVSPGPYDLDVHMCASWS